MELPDRSTAAAAKAHSEKSLGLGRSVSTILTQFSGRTFLDLELQRLPISIDHYVDVVIAL